MSRLKIGLYGTNGHQVHRRLADHPKAELVAAAGFPPDGIPDECGEVRRYDSLGELLADAAVELVGLCSPRRVDQAQDAIRCMEAGKHVYAEKPCALSESDLDAIIDTSRRMGVQFHEQAATLMQQPYRGMRECVAAGTIGTVVQVYGQKSYPWHERRPGDEQLDGGLAAQAGIYLMRFIEHIAGVKVTRVELTETTLGTPAPSECRRAASYLMDLENGGVATGICNYLNPMKHVCWGYEILRIFGTEGIVESCAEGRQARLILDGKDPEPLDVSAPTEDYLDLFIDALQGGAAMPLSLEDELSPTRWVIRAKWGDA